MAKKKKKSPAQNLYKSSKNKLIRETVENSFPEDTKSEQSQLRSALKGQPTKAVKQAVKTGGTTGNKNKKTPLHAVLTGTPNKAIKELVKAPYAKAEEARKLLNKEYRKERNKLYRRVQYFKAQGYEFNDDIVPPRLEDNATQEDIDYLKALRGTVLKRMATGFNPLSDSSETTVEDVVDSIADIESEPGEESVYDFDDYADLTPSAPSGPSWEDVISGDYDDDDIEPIESPEERYYRENPERKHDAKGSKPENDLVLQEIYDDIHSQPALLHGRLNLRTEAQVQFYDDLVDNGRELQMLLDETAARLAGDNDIQVGYDALAQIVEANAETMRKLVDQILWLNLYIGNGETYADVLNKANAAFTPVKSILSGDSPAALMRDEFGDPDDI